MSDSLKTTLLLLIITRALLSIWPGLCVGVPLPEVKLAKVFLLKRGDDRGLRPLPEQEYINNYS